jgi:hypothetical protein
MRKEFSIRVFTWCIIFFVKNAAKLLMNLKKNVIGVDVKLRKKMKINLDKKDVLFLLDRSFELGYNGYLDLKKEIINDLLDEFLINKEKIKEEEDCVAYCGFPTFPVTMTSTKF